MDSKYRFNMRLPISQYWHRQMTLQAFANHTATHVGYTTRTFRKATRLLNVAGCSLYNVFSFLTIMSHEWTQRPHRDCDRAVFERFLWRKGQQWTAAGAGKLGAADLGMAWALLEEVTINPTIQLPELKQDWELDSQRAQTEACMHQDPGKRSSDPLRD